jgi:hypothetical protein
MVFLLNLFKNSATSIQKIIISSRDQIVTLPAISLPNLTVISIKVYQNNNNRVKDLDYLMKTFVDVRCPYLKVFKIHNIYKAPKILIYFLQHYSNHFVCGPEISTLEHIPLKICYIDLEKLTAYRYASHIEYLILHVKNLQVASDGGWDNYREILSFFPNLKGIVFYYNKKYTTLVSLLRRFPSTSQNIWQQRIDYFKSQNIMLLQRKQIFKIISDLRQSLSPSWMFQFYGI